MLDVRIEVPRRGRTVAARIGAAEVFGEMSLLTGAPRSADVVALVDSAAYEVSKAALAPILHRRPELASRMGEILAARRSANVAIESASAADDQRVPVRPDGAEMLARMRAFFGLE
jgi:CRP-like cAMP-binding protein